ncbi:uncharacterized protein LOC133413481 [Phycodurus eques]|uniref:uncharacterized protein LOC133413481 n=1 Tax=Phycodurus eques TaxID=693459 RepID=UPI002ACEC376|nr:uncharacterized protein LOC133413481 [Phycodurus eques]
MISNFATVWIVLFQCRCLFLLSCSRGQFGQKSSGEDVQDGKAIGHTDDVGASRAKTLDEEEELFVSPSELSGEFLDSVGSDSFVEMDFNGKEETEATESAECSRDESGKESTGEDAGGRLADDERERDAVPDSGARQYEEERSFGATSDDKSLSSDKSGESAKQPFVRCSACVRRDNEREDHEKTPKSAEAVGRSGTKVDDEPGKSSTDSAAVVGDGDLAEEMSELEVQSDDRRPESPRQEVSERVLDSNDLVFETETSSKSRVEDVYSDFVAQEREHIQCHETDGRRKGEEEEELSKATGRKVVF